MTAAYPVIPAVPEPVRWACVFPGAPAQVREARRFVARVLAGCPARETLVTCVSELCTNAIEHTASGDGGVFAVEVLLPGEGVARIAVTDAGAATGPDPGRSRRHEAGDLAEGGRGLALVAACTSRWGYRDAGAGAPLPGRTVWAEATWPVAVPDTWSEAPRPTRASTVRRDWRGGDGAA